MLWWRRRGTIIGKGLKVVGKVTAEGLVKVFGQIDGELQCTSLVVSRKAHVNGAITAEKVTVDGRVEGPIAAAVVMLKSRAQVVGDIRHQSLAIERGAEFEGRSIMAQRPSDRDHGKTDETDKKPARQTASNREPAAPRSGLMDKIAEVDVG
jgi:cytoskeletal protein CcmA (bactofilin family)